MATNLALVVGVVIGVAVVLAYCLRRRKHYSKAKAHLDRAPSACRDLPLPAGHVVAATKSTAMAMLHEVDGNEMPPSVWMTSSGFSRPRLAAQFVRVLLKRRGVELDTNDIKACSPRVIVDKYADVLRTLRVVVVLDGNFFKSDESMVPFHAQQKTFFWDHKLVEQCGVAPENITSICLFRKPWLFNLPPLWGGIVAAQAPNACGVDPADQAAWLALLEAATDTYHAIAAGKEPPPRPSGRSIANELAEMSAALDKKYAAALKTWCSATFAKTDVVAGQGGDVVALNLAYQISQPFAKALICDVRGGNTLYASLSASTMVTARSMEMTKEILPGSMQHLSADPSFLDPTMFPACNLADDDGIATSKLGALPMFASPMAMRPHFSEDWMEKVMERNKEAEAEYEAEQMEEVDDEMVVESSDNVRSAIRLLNVIAKNAHQQDNPVFVPMMDGQAIEVFLHGDTEKFKVVT